MANLLQGRKASHKSGYEGFDLSHYVNFTSSTGHILPIHYDLLLPGDKVTISTMMKSILMPMNSASPIVLREHVDYYFVPLECLFSLFPSLLSNTNEDASSSLFDTSKFVDGFPLVDIAHLKKVISESEDQLDEWFFDNRIASANRLIEFFHYGMKIYNENVMPDVVQMSNVLLVQAYNAVWEYFFRDDKRFSFRSELFNFDKYYQTNVVPYQPLSEIPFFELKYRQLKKDPYTITSPQPLGSANTINKYDNSSSGFQSYVKQWLSSGLLSENMTPDGQPTENIYTSSPGGMLNPPNNLYKNTDTVFPNQLNEDSELQSLQQHRIAMAVEKLSSIWYTSGKSYKEQMQNLFGVNDVQEDWSKPQYIGSDINEIEINPEIANVSTALGDEVLTNAGEIVGKGYGENTPNQSSFTAKTHGILLALYSCVPESIYYADTFDIFNTYHKRSSFPNPVTDELGEQPAFRFEFGIDTSGNIGNNIVGWLPRFHELKLKANRAYGGFKSTLAYWLPTISFDSYDFAQQPWLFYCRPNMLDNIMLKQYDTHLDSDAWTSQGTNYAFYDSDPIMHFFRVNCHKASKMSTYGVPDTYFG